MDTDSQGLLPPAPFTQRGKLANGFFIRVYPCPSVVSFFQLPDSGLATHQTPDAPAAPVRRNRADEGVRAPSVLWPVHRLEAESLRSPASAAPFPLARVRDQPSLCRIVLDVMHCGEKVLFVANVAVVVILLPPLAAAQRAEEAGRKGWLLPHY